MNKFILLVLASSLSACGIFSTSDGAVGITGNLGQHLTESCFAKVLLESNREVWSFDLSQDAEGNFSQNFTVAPRSEKYKIEIVCDGKVVTSRTIAYPDDLEDGFYLNFGVVGQQKT